MRRWSERAGAYILVGINIVVIIIIPKIDILAASVSPGNIIHIIYVS